MLTASCLASAPAGLLADNVPGPGSLTGPLTSHYPVAVNSLPPAQEPGAPRRPSAPVPCAASAPAASGSPPALLGRLGRLLGSGPGGRGPAEEDRDQGAGTCRVAPGMPIHEGAVHVSGTMPSRENRRCAAGPAR